MGKYIVEGAGVAICDHEDNYLVLDSDCCVPISRLATKAGATTLKWTTLGNFEMAGTQHDDTGRYQRGVEDYRADTGRQFPPVYKFRVTVEVEPVSDEEVREWWRKKRAENE